MKAIETPCAFRLVPRMLLPCSSVHHRVQPPGENIGSICGTKEACQPLSNQKRREERALLFSPIAISSDPQVVEMMDGGTNGVAVETLPDKLRTASVKI